MDEYRQRADLLQNQQFARREAKDILWPRFESHRMYQTKNRAPGFRSETEG
jgi:hypothetical protein